MGPWTYLFFNYIFDSSECAGTRVYVLDTGFELLMRAFWGANFYPGAPNTDDNRHETHCARTIGGYSTGVCILTQLYAVKVCNLAGSYPTSYIISGIRWAQNHVKSTSMSKKSVFSISHPGSSSTALNNAVTSAINSGIPVVVAAGNAATPSTIGNNACLNSPRSATGVIAVAAGDINDTMPLWSNYGSCCSVFAPGVNVLSSWGACDICYNTLSGTSMSTPHVAGLSPYLIAKEGLSGGTAVLNRLVNLATLNSISNPDGTPNRIAYNGDGC